MTQGMEEAEVPNAFFASVFASKIGLKDTQFLETMENSEARKSLPLMEEVRIRDYLKKVGIHKCMDPDGM